MSTCTLTGDVCDRYIITWIEHERKSVMKDREEFKKIVAESVEVLLKMDVDTYNMTKIVLLICRKEHDACREYLQKLFAFTDQRRPLLIRMK